MHKHLLVYITRYPGIGGIETVTRTMVPHLQNHGYTVSILSHVQQGVMDLHEVALYCMPDGDDFRSEKNMAYAMEVMETVHPDAIAYQDNYAPTERIVCRMATEWHVPLYVFEHNSPRYIYNWLRQYPLCSLKGIAWRSIFPWLLHKERRRKRMLFDACTRYVLLARAYIPEFAAIIGVSADDPKLTFINNPAPTFPVAMTTEKENIILCVCQLNKAKGVDYMLKIWQRVSPQLPDWRFVIVGDGKERGQLEQEVRQKHLERITFEGFQKPTKYYAKAKLFWMTSRYEGWPMTIVEAMHYGCVPIAYNAFSSLNDMIDDGTNGRVVAYGDEHAFADATLGLAHEETVRASMAAEAMKKPEHYTVDKIAAAWMKLLA